MFEDDVNDTESSAFELSENVCISLFEIKTLFFFRFMISFSIAEILPMVSSVDCQLN